jgi:hypothetical protein
MAQILTAVSPAMFKEFEVDYAKRWCDRFGLVYFGCCEALDTKMEYVRMVPNVRKVSITQLADVERGAAEIGRDYVFRRPSRRSSPVAWDPACRADLKTRSIGARATVPRGLSSGREHGRGQPAPVGGADIAMRWSSRSHATDDGGRTVGHLNLGPMAGKEDSHRGRRHAASMVETHHLGSSTGSTTTG